MNVHVVSTLLAAAAAAALSAGPVAAAASDDPVAYVDPFQEGSVNDAQNIQTATLSDLTGVSAQVNPNGCVAVAERPKLQPSDASSTGMIVTTQISLTCQGVSSGSDTFRIRRVRWYGSDSLASFPLAVSPTGVATQSLTTPCRAGTWSYFAAVTGTHTFHTQSARFTCVKASDIFYIDPN